VGQFTDDRGAWLLLFHHGNQVLHALRNSTRQGPGRRRCCRRQSQCQRVEWSCRAPASARAHRRHEGAARFVGTKFRSGIRGYQDPALGQTALEFLAGYPLADFLPFIESPHFETPGVKSWGFFSRPGFWDQTLRNTRLIIVSSRLGGTRLDSSMERWWGNSVRNSTGGSGGLHR
jgi:hypothetical protein